MKAGDLDRQIELIRTTKGRDAFGGETAATTAIIATVAAAKPTLRLADVQRAQLHSDQADGKFVIRWRSDVTNDMQVTYGGKTYSIISTEEIGRKRWLAILVRAG